MFNLRDILVVSVVVLVVSRTAAKCVPGPVSSVQLSENYTLYWSAASNPDSCTIANYVLYVKNLAEGTLQLYNAPGNVLSLNVSFLEFCTSYSFEVHALTNESVLGPATAHAFTTAPSADMNLNLTMNAVTLTDNEMTVSWSLVDQGVGKCVSFYRLVYWDETDHPKDVYVYNNTYTLLGQVPCMEYEFQVRAIVGNPEIEGPFSTSTTSTYGEVPSPPKISTIVPTNETVSMEWVVDSYSKNRCEIFYLEIDTIGATDSPRRIIYQDSTSRPPFKFTLTGLKPDTVYMSHVYVVNSAGSSKNTTVTFQTNDS